MYVLSCFSSMNLGLSMNVVGTLDRASIIASNLALPSRTLGTTLYVPVPSSHREPHTNYEHDLFLEINLYRINTAHERWYAAQMSQNYHLFPFAYPECRRTSLFHPCPRLFSSIAFPMSSSCRNSACDFTMTVFLRCRNLHSTVFIF